MALGAYRAAKRHGLESKMYFIGIDALPGEQGGVQMVLDKILNASLLYPTGGEEAIRLALKILNGQSFLRENILQTVLVDSSNARILRMQYNQILEHQKKIKAQQKVLERQLKLYKAQKMRFYLALLGLIIVLLVVSFLIRAYLLIRRINNELEEKNRKIEKQRKEITHQRDLLKTMHEKAEQAHRLKIQFFTNVSHEFRTPLTLILGTIDRLENNLKNINAQNSILLSLLKKNSKHLLKLVNQLLDFRKLEEGKLKLYAEYDNIIPFLENIASTFEILAVWKEIDYRFIAEQKEINVWFDKEKLDKTMFNLISNAFKFTPNKGQIEIIVKKEEMQQTLEKSVAISVIDTGIGIPNNEIDHIFEPFYVIHEHSRTHSVSSGIGLALCKSYVEMHHGQILVESEIGKGTAFTIYLPLGDGHLSTEEKFLSHSGEAKIVEPLIELEAEPFELIEKTFTNLEISHKKDKKIILVVEDNQDTRNFLRLLLETEYEIIEAKDGQVGLNKARRLVPDLIITDIMMPKMDGIEMSKQIRNDLRISHIPILMLTAKSSDESRLESYQTGADAFLSKPFNEKILKARIENLLETRKRLRKLFQKNPMTFLQDESMKVQEKSFFEKVVELIEQNLDNSSFSVDQLGQEIGFTRVHLYRKIKALTGKTPSEFIRNYRLQKAADLLKNTDLNISEVAYRVGFESPSYFSKCFHEMFNCTPSEFINNKTE